MTDTPTHPLPGTDGFGSPELHATLRDLLGTGGRTVRLVSQRKLSRSRVYRAHVEAGTTVHSLILKCVSPHIGQRNEMVVRRWLPAAGLSRAAASLLAIAAERDGQRVWHVYEDLGDHALVATDPGVNGPGSARLGTPRECHADPARIDAALALIAQVHARFARHPLLAECRSYGEDFGSHFFASAVKDATRALEALLARDRELSTAWIELLNRLLNTMQALAREAPQRTQALAETGGPETLLHGDLWPINVIVYPEGQALCARLVDWDHVGVGAVSYDLSNFLARFPRADRPRMMDVYLLCMDRLGWRFPPDTDWNLLFDTAENARLAVTVAWDAIAALDDPSVWAYEDLTAVDQWFGMLEPVMLPNLSDNAARR